MSRTALRHHRPLTPYLFVAPYVVLLLTFVVGPAVFGFWMSLHNWDFMLPGKPWVGLQNYRDLLDAGSVIFHPFWNGMKNTFLFVLMSVPFLVAIPLGLSLLLNQKFAGRTFFRAVVFTPFVLGVAVVGLLFGYLFDPEVGLINGILSGIGLPKVSWLTTQPQAWITILVTTIWWTIGFNAVIFLAGLQGLPGELYEAAELDGAGRWARFRHVTVPGLRNIFLFVVTTTILASANLFGQPYILTRGGPGDSTTTAIMAMTNEGLRGFRMGTAAAMSYVLALALTIISIANFLIMRERRPS
ncbi:sugar ABC transporter permease [Actinopolymorpha sp. NPDC004070]|uniref:carbohydrate ABC transporter permease n=1 Tax=Actinopolymorpha sp. NPDC004070 TaxID=3154548 RepID=UPI0033AAEB5C